MNKTLWYLAGLVTLPVLWLALTVVGNLLGVILRSVWDTQSILCGQWRLFRYAPSVFAERLGMQWKAMRGGYELTAIQIDRSKIKQTT